MLNPLRFGTALSVIAVATLAGGCAGPMERAGRASMAKTKSADFALGTRAQAALAVQDYAAAVDYAERAVEQSPSNIDLRILLGNAYFASGRFASAEAAYRDSLSLAPNPQVGLKLALVQIAQGHNDSAAQTLYEVRPVLNASDFGLALALAGRTGEAVPVLEAAARAPAADAQVRQNLALALALAGDWSASRIVAAQDLPANMVDARVQQWMTMAATGKGSDQVAALVGVTPAAVDPGQPVRLALNAGNTRMAEAAPAVPAPVAFAEASPAAVAEIAPAAPVAIAKAAPPVAVSVPEVSPVVSAEVAALHAAPAPAFEAPAPIVPASAKRSVGPRKAGLAKASGKSNAVVQLGAYSSRENLARGWETLTRRYPALKGFTPQIARFDSDKGMVYRLSIKGFDSQQAALASCGQLKGRGASCFVRSVAGDAPIQMASR